MNLLKIIFSGIVLFFLFIFVFALSYFPYSKPNIIQINTKTNNYVGLSKVIENKEKYSLEETEKFQKDYIFKDNVDKIDEFYFLPKSQNSYKKTITGNNVKIDVEDGLYFANIVDLTFNFKINNKNFTLTPKSPGRFYFDTRDNSKIKIFSFDSIVEISLLDAEKKQVSTTMVLYPHMNFTFNSTRNKLVKNADLLRLESIFDISYIKESFLSFEIKDFIDVLYKADDKEVLSFFSVIKSLVYSQDNYSKYDNLDKLLIQNNYTLPGFQYITKYFVLFLNDSKKSVYYKNIILEELNNLAKAKEDYEVNSYKNELKETLDKLKEINENDYKEMYDLVSYYYDILLKVNDVKYINNAFALSKLLIELDGTAFTNKNTNSAFLLSKLYSIIDNTDFEKVDLQSNLMTYLNSFFKENNITVDEKNKSLVIKNGRKVVKDLDSLSFFVKNVLLYNTNFSDNDDISDTISLLKTYFYVNNSLTILIQNKYESFLIEYSSILDKVLSEMRKAFFEEELDGDKLLVLNKKNFISKNDLAKLNTTIKLFFDFNTKNKSYLSEKNMIYDKFYERNAEEYKEYYLALSNYDEYSILYNKTKNELLSTKTVLENKEDIVLSVENFKKYITQFLGVDLSSSTVKIVNGEYYKVDKVSINGANFSFDLYPKSQNLLNNIYKNGSALNLSYELDSLEYDLKDLYEGADDEQKDKYDFRRFFLNTFFGNNLPTQTTQQFVYESNAPVEEDRAISLFKRDKLVGSKGDFSILRGFLDVSYNDVIVKLNGANYDITLSGSKLTTNIESGDSLYGLFSSKYYFSDTDHYFDNIRISLYTESNNGEKNFLFGGTQIQINKKINVVDFKKEISSILEKRFGGSK